MSQEATAVPSGAVSPAVFETPLVFTGEGAEYFRVWVVNTALTVATVGIYSAWAKVRKTSYFSRNTRLLGDSFEFTADPLAILRGRLLALALFGFYTFAFDFSLTLGLIATTTLLVLAPLFFASALRFRLHNTRWRAIRFGFAATHGHAYRTVLVVVGLWLSTAVAGALGGKGTVTVGAITLLLLPWMHHRLKAFQHRHVRLGAHASSFWTALGRFYGTYLLAALVLLAAGAGAGIMAGAFMATIGRQLGLDYSGLAIVMGVLVAVLGYLAAWPYFAARIQRVVWERTTLGPISFKTTIAFDTLLPIAAKNMALLLLTAGLYWPYASIAWARYRIGCMTLVSSESPERTVLALAAGGPVGAVGEGAVDFFGIDIGW